MLFMTYRTLKKEKAESGASLVLNKLLPCDRSRIPLGGALNLPLKDTSQILTSQVKQRGLGGDLLENWIRYQENWDWKTVTVKNFDVSKKIDLNIWVTWKDGKTKVSG